MKLVFTKSALDAYNALKQSGTETAAKIKDILKDALQHPETGLGSPSPLMGDLSSKWMRTFGPGEFLVYSFSRESLKVHHIEAGPINAGFKLEGFSKEEEDAVMSLMAANRGHGSDPKVGIFWYNRATHSLFGIVSHRVSDYTKANASCGRITCSEMHEDVWKKEYYRQRYHSDGKGPFIGAYQDKPRGRVFYNLDGTFEVAVGKWLEEYPEAYDLILKEFDLPPEKTSAKYAIHWDIGQSWR